MGGGVTVRVRAQAARADMRSVTPWYTEAPAPRMKVETPLTWGLGAIIRECSPAWAGDDH